MFGIDFSANWCNTKKKKKKKKIAFSQLAQNFDNLKIIPPTLHKIKKLLHISPHNVHFKTQLDGEFDSINSYVLWCTEQKSPKITIFFVIFFKMVVFGANSCL